MTGAMGFLGDNILRYLLDSGENIDITALVRRDDFSWKDRVRSVTSDLEDISPDVISGQRYDVAIHLAALMADKDDIPRSEFYRINVEGTKRLITAMRKSGLRQFIHISTVGVYGSTGTNPVEEEGKYGEKLSNYEWSKMEAEKVAIACCKEIGVPLTILRIGLMYGEGMSYGWPSTIRSIQKKEMRIIGEGNALIQLSYIRDIVEGIALTIGNKLAYDSIFNLCGEQVCSLSKVFSIIAHILDVPVPQKVPFLPVYALSQVLSYVPESFKGDKLKLLTPHRVVFFRENHVYNIEKARNTLGFCPKYSVVEGMETTIKDYMMNYNKNK
tara:strand:+ start:1521 stop:2504 length:984 start_codon:yes stop_codon:yes gene_type:complete